MEEKRTRSGKLYNDTHAQCLSPNPSTHAIGAMLTVGRFDRDFNKNVSRVKSHCKNCNYEYVKRRRREKTLNSICRGCNLPAVFGLYCEWHWFRNTATRAFGYDKRVGKFTTQECDALTVHIRSIYPKDEICPCCGKTMTRRGGSLNDGIKANHWRNASLDAIHPERGHVAGNVLWVCFKCNQIKGDSGIEDIRRRIESLRTIERIMRQRG